MASTVTDLELSELQKLVQSKGVAGASEAYEYLKQRGFAYAGWAGGVARGDSVTGTAALDYLRGSASLGIGSEACKNLSPAQIDQIRINMADAYLSQLQKIASGTNKILERDVNFAEASAFHAKVFGDNGLSLENWTLKTPMDFIREDEGEEAVEAYWTKLRETGGEGPMAWLYSAQLVQLVISNLGSADADRRKRALDWLANAGMRTQERLDELERQLEKILERLGTRKSPRPMPVVHQLGAGPSPGLRRVVVVGDSTDHGGEVLTGEQRATIDGRATARIGDLVSCPFHGDNRIVEGEPLDTVFGRAVALEGHRTECGSRLVGSRTSYVESSTTLAA